jgi:hypothetical protein
LLRGATIEDQLRRAAVALVHLGADQCLPCSLVQRINEQQSLSRNDRGVGLVLLGQHTLGHRTGGPGQAIVLVSQPVIELGINADEVFKKRPLKQLQAAGLGGRCSRQYSDVHPETVIQQREVVAVRL